MKVSAKSLLTAEKENLSDKELQFLLNDTNAVLWKVPGTKKLAECTVQQLIGTNVASILMLQNMINLFNHRYCQESASHQKGYIVKISTHLYNGV